jgi:hypothetical protein
MRPARPARSLRRVVGSLGLAGSIAVLAAGPALASHTHVRILGNGSCVILAPDSGEEAVQLPFADSFAPDRQHPLHVLVHFGMAGMGPDGSMRVWVQGSAGDLANCDGYVNLAADDD